MFPIFLLLQDPSNKRYTICDEELEKIIGILNCLSLFDSRMLRSSIC